MHGRAGGGVGPEVGPRRVAGHGVAPQRTAPAGPAARAPPPRHAELLRAHARCHKLVEYSYFVILLLTKKQKMVVILDRRMNFA